VQSAGQSAVQCSAWCSAVQRGAEQCLVQWSAVECNAVQCSGVQAAGRGSIWSASGAPGRWEPGTPLTVPDVHCTTGHCTGCPLYHCTMG
jgi:hypothetical protein